MELKTVKVAGVMYTIEEQDGMLRENDRLGMVLYPESRIIIESSMSNSKKEQVFIHELTHAIFNEAGFDEQNEDIVNRVSIVLHQVLKDNKINFHE